MSIQYCRRKNEIIMNIGITYSAPFTVRHCMFHILNHFLSIWVKSMLLFFLRRILMMIITMICLKINKESIHKQMFSKTGIRQIQNRLSEGLFYINKVLTFVVFTIVLHSKHCCLIFVNSSQCPQHMTKKMMRSVCTCQIISCS